MVEFGELQSDGNVRHVRTIEQASIASCPHLIFDPSHYREDGSCRCDDRDDPHMADWGYVWNNGRKRWMSPPDPNARSWH